MTETLSNVAPLCAIFGFILILIKSAIGAPNIKQIMCLHLVVISVVAAVLYVVRGMTVQSDGIPGYALSAIWVIIGISNFIEYQTRRRRLNDSNRTE